MSATRGGGDAKNKKSERVSLMITRARSQLSAKGGDCARERAFIHPQPGDEPISALYRQHERRRALLAARAPSAARAKTTGERGESERSPPLGAAHRTHRRRHSTRARVDERLQTFGKSKRRRTMTSGCTTPLVALKIN